MNRHVLPLACLLSFLPLTVHAATIDLSWNACSPIVSVIDPATPGPVKLYASIIGMTELSQAYEVWIYIDDGNKQLPDAWRFDPDGCQGSSRVNIEYVPPAALANACPPLPGAAHLVLKAFRNTPVLGPGEICNPTNDCTLPYALLARTYSPSLVAPDPNQRYFLVSWEFDLTNSVVGENPGSEMCGGYERGMRIRIAPMRAGYITMAPNEEVQFQRGQETVYFHGDMLAVPAVNATWGQIKGQYRR